MFLTHLEVESAPFCDVELGEIFDIKGKRYILLARNPWRAKVARYTWLDHLLVRAVEKLRR